MSSKEISPAKKGAYLVQDNAIVICIGESKFVELTLDKTRASFESDLALLCLKLCYMNVVKQPY